MTVMQLISELESAGIQLWEESGQIRFRAPKRAMTEEWRNTLRQHKEEVIDLLQHRAEAATVTPDNERRHERFPLTDVQAAYLIGRNDAYIYGGSACQVYTEIAFPDLEPPRLEAAWNELIHRHDMLRTVIHADGYQRVLPEVPYYRIRVADLRGHDVVSVGAAIEAVRADMDHHVYKTDEWPLFEFRLTLTEKRALLHVSIDFLIADYLSIQLLLSELSQLYFEPERPLPQLDITFRDYLLTERRLHESSRYERARAYWLRRIDYLPPAPELPVVAQSAGANERFRRWQVTLSPEEFTSLCKQAGAHGITPSVAVLAAYAEVIGRWSRRPQFTLNLTLLNRQALHPHVGNLVGDFTTISLLAIDQNVAASFENRARVLGAQLFEDMDHRLYSGMEVMREISRRREREAALMPIVFTSTIGLKDSGIRHGELVFGISQTPQLWIDCQAVEDGGALTISWDVREGLFPSGMVCDMFDALVTLLRRLAAEDAPWKLSSPVPLPVVQSERRRMTNDTSAPLPDLLLHERVIEQALRSPDRSAVISVSRSLSYAELFGLASGVAETLRAAGSAPHETVAVVMGKGWEQVVAVLGTLLAGAAYLPIDTNQPIGRRNQILADANVRYVLTQSSLVADESTWPEAAHIVRVDTLQATRLASTPPRIVGPDHLAYVIYTSGSTGTPKGVMISHRSALNTIDDINRRFGVCADDRILSLANLGFDLSVYDLFGPLSLGACVVLPDPARRGDPSHWTELIATQGITLWNSVPAQMQMLHDYLESEPERDLPSLRLALLSGDWIPVTLPDQIRRHLPALKLISLGGATEAAIWSIFYPIGDVRASWSSIPYGKPLTNQSFQALDSKMQPSPEWVAGELYIGGAGVALGYLGDETKTAERFIYHPETGERLYRTGDFGRYLPDGNIEFLGREDRQVKIRGHRIELAEIEAALQSHRAVAAATVLVEGASMDQRVAAFVETARRADDDQAVQDVARVVHAAVAAGHDARAGVDCARFVEWVKQLDEAALLAMVHALREQGLFATTECTHSAEEILARAKVVHKHQRLIRGWLSVLEAEEKLERDPATGYYRLVRLVAGADVDAAWRQVNDSEFEAGFNKELLGYMRLSQQHLPELMRDEVGAVQLVFPEGGTDVWEGAYRDNLVSKYVNRTIAATLREIAGQREGIGPLRVLEVGAGVGGITEELIRALDGFDVDYLFTDVSQFFLTDARERFRDYSWIRFGLFDLNQDYRAQGLTPNSFDVIVSAHVMHYSRHAGQALARLREILTPSGWVVFIDMTREGYQIMASMMFLGGDTPDFEDMRQGRFKTFVTREQWLDLLASAGGETVLCLPEIDDVFAPLGQQVFAARFKRDRKRVDVKELGTHVATRLPEYMVPHYIQVVDAFPLSDTGKLDRRTLRTWLPRETPQQVAVSSSEPQNELERRLANLWAELLGLERVSRDQDFFKLGGDSLLAARLVGRLREEVPEASGLFWDSLMREFMPEPTIAALTRHLVKASGGLGDDAPTTHALSDGSLVSLGGMGGGPICVFVHDGSGTIASYHALINELTGDGPFVGVVVNEIDRYLQLDPSLLVERLATDYTRLLLAREDLRFRLVGYHSGAQVATEIARQLSEGGAKIENLTVISSYPFPARVDDELLLEYLFARGIGIDPIAVGFPSETPMGLAIAAIIAETPNHVPDGRLAADFSDSSLADVAYCFRQMAQRSQQDRLADISRTLGSAQSELDEKDQILRRYAIFRHSLTAAIRHRVLPYAGDITLLRHVDEIPLWPSLREDMTRFWEELCLGALRVVDVPGDHFTCVQPPHAKRAAELLAAEWGRDQ